MNPVLLSKYKIEGRKQQQYERKQHYRVQKPDEQQQRAQTCMCRVADINGRANFRPRGKEQNEIEYEPKQCKSDAAAKRYKAAFRDQAE